MKSSAKLGTVTFDHFCCLSLIHNAQLFITWEVQDVTSTSQVILVKSLLMEVSILWNQSTRTRGTLGVSDQNPI